MASAVIYLDESGDLGWTLDRPYRSGGSSRYLTIGALIVPSEKTHLPRRLIKRLYVDRKWQQSSEKKWTDMSADAKADFCNRAVKMKLAEPDIAFTTITVKKENVQAHIRADSNKLYNFMIKMLLLDHMAKLDHVVLVPDPRTIKVQSGNSLHDYLQTELWFTKNVATKLNTIPQDSSKCKALQFTDMLVGAVFKYHQDNDSASWNILAPHITALRRFF